MQEIITDTAACCGLIVMASASLAITTWALYRAMEHVSKITGLTSLILEFTADKLRRSRKRAA